MCHAMEYYRILDDAQLKAVISHLYLPLMVMVDLRHSKQVHFSKNIHGLKANLRKQRKKA